MDPAELAALLKKNKEQEAADAEAGAPGAGAPAIGVAAPDRVQGLGFV